MCGLSDAVKIDTWHCGGGVCSTFSSLDGWEIQRDNVMPRSPRHTRMKRRRKKTQETLTLAVGLWPRTRIAKVFALRLVAVRVLLRGIGRRQAIGEAGDGRQALLVRGRGRRSHGGGGMSGGNLSGRGWWRWWC